MQLIFFVLFSLTILSIVLFSLTILSILISLEFLIVILFSFLMFIYYKESPESALMLLVLAVSESVLGLVLMTLKVFFCGSDLMSTLDT